MCKNLERSPNLSPFKSLNNSLNDYISDTNCIHSGSSPLNLKTKSPSPSDEKLTSFTTGSLDRKQLRGNSKRNLLNPKENRKSVISPSSIGRQIKPSLSEKPSIPPLNVPLIPNRPLLHSIERPSVPPPDRPSRDSHVTSKIKVSSLENICDIQNDSSIFFSNSFENNKIISENKSPNHSRPSNSNQTEKIAFADDSDHEENSSH